MKVTFTNGQPATPVAVATGFDFPTSVTVCVPAKAVCPVPDRRDRGALVGPVGEPCAGRRAKLERSGQGRIWLIGTWWVRGNPGDPAGRPSKCARCPLPLRWSQPSCWPDAVASTALGAPRRYHGPGPCAPGPWDWPTYGHDAQHTFHGRTTLTPDDGEDTQGGLVLPHRRRGDRHPDGGQRHGLRRVRGTTTSMPSISRPAPCGGSTG